MKSISLTVFAVLFGLLIKGFCASEIRDTIIDFNGKSILCTITKVENDRVYYIIEENQKEKSQSLASKSITDFSLGGVTNLAYEESYIVYGRTSRAQIFSTISAWFTAPSDGVTKQVINSNEEKGIIAGNFTIPFACTDEAGYCQKATGKISFDVSVSIQARTCHYILTNFRHTSEFGRVGSGISFGKITTASNCFSLYIDGPQDMKNHIWSEIKAEIAMKANVLIGDLKSRLGAF